MPKVSVIIPNYNHARFLDERLSSVLGQTFQDFEVIILDDCSTDGSKDVIEKYRGNPKVSRIVYNEQNSGSSFRQWDKGISLAEGELIWIAESDDSADPKLLETLVAEFDRDPKCVLAFCSAMLTDPEGKSIGIHPYHKALGGWENGAGEGFIRKHLCKDNSVVNASGALFRKSAFVNLPAFADPAYKSFKGVGDWLFWIGIASQGNVAFRPDAMNRFRQHGGNTTSTLAKNGRGIIEAACLFGILEREKYISSLQGLNIKASNTAIIKYLRKDLDDTTRAECLRAWGAGTPVVSLLAAIKRIIHRKYRG